MPAFSNKLAVNVRPLTPARWKDFVTLFGPRGACAGCWCMEPRQTRSEWERFKGAQNRRMMRRLVHHGFWVCCRWRWRSSADC